MKKALIASLFILAGSLAHAQTQPAAGAEGVGNSVREHHEPRKIAAECAGKSVGTPVTVTFHGKTRTIECGVHHHRHKQGEGDGSGNGGWGKGGN